MRLRRLAGLAEVVRLADAGPLNGTVIVIDVLRAFTTAPMALASGARAVELVSSPAEAFARRERVPEAILVGEVHGRPIRGFDHGNSPARMARLDLRGRTVVLRSTSGVQGVLRALAPARVVLAASLVNVSATAARAHRLGNDVALLAMGAPGEPGPEDEACADVLEALLRGTPPDLEAALARVRGSPAAQRAMDPGVGWISPEDLECALAVDRVPFALEARRAEGVTRLEPVGLAGTPVRVGPEGGGGNGR